MTQSRRLEPGRAHATTRRTARRCLFLLPTPEVTKIVAFSAAHAFAQTPTFEPLAFMSNSTHLHCAGLDQGRLGGPPPGELERPSVLPVVMQRMHSLMARALNTHFGRGEALWRDGSYGNVEIHDQAALDEQLFYNWLQVVKDGLVSSPDLWPGFKLMPEDFGRTITVPRPKGAFFGGRRPDGQRPAHPGALAEWLAELAEQEREALAEARRRRREADRARGRTSERRRKLEEERERRRLRAEARRERERAERGDRPRRDRSTLPEFVTFTVGVPPGWEGRVEEARAHFRAELDARVLEIQRQFAAEGRTFMGLEAVLAQDPRESAGDTWPTFSCNPRIACKDKETRIRAKLSLRAWRAEMREKQRAWARGQRDVVFPRGAYAVWRFHAALVVGGFRPAPFDPPDPELAAGGPRWLLPPPPAPPDGERDLAAA